MFSIVLMYAISASTFMISKQLLAYTAPLFLSGIRTLFATLIFFVYLQWTNGKHSYKNYLFSCATVGFFSFYLSNTLKFFAMQTLSSQKAALIALIEPFFASLFAYLLCNEIMTSKRWFGLTICIIGAATPVIAQYNGSFHIALPELLLLGSVITSSFGALLMRKLVRIQNYSATVVNCISMGSAGISSLLTSFILEDTLKNSTALTHPNFLLLLIVMVLVSNIFAYSLYGKLVTQYSAILISSAGLLRPFFVACYSGMFDLQMLLSTIFIALGILILYQEEKPLAAETREFYPIA